MRIPSASNQNVLSDFNVLETVTFVRIRIRISSFILVEVALFLRFEKKLNDYRGSASYQIFEIELELYRRMRE